MQINFKRGLKNEKQQHPYDLIFYYSYLYMVIRHGENPIDGGTIRSLLVPILNIHLRIKNNINDSLKIVRTFHFKSQNILIKKYILFKENVPAIFRTRLLYFSYGNNHTLFYCESCCKTERLWITMVFRSIEIIPSCSISAKARAKEGRVTPKKSAISCCVSVS